MSHITMTPEQVAVHQKWKERSRKVTPGGGTGGLAGRGTSTQPRKAGERGKSTPGKPRLRSLTEEQLATQLELVGIKLEREYRWLPGRKYRADFACPEKKLLFEIDGAVHRINDKFHRDIRKRQDAILNSWTMCPIAAAQVRDGSALTLIERVLAMTVTAMPPQSSK